MSAPEPPESLEDYARKLSLWLYYEQENIMGPAGEHTDEPVTVYGHCERVILGLLAKLEEK